MPSLCCRTFINMSVIFGCVCMRATVGISMSSGRLVWGDAVWFGMERLMNGSTHCWRYLLVHLCYWGPRWPRPDPAECPENPGNPWHPRWNSPWNLLWGKTGRAEERDRWRNGREKETFECTDKFADDTGMVKALNRISFGGGTQRGRWMDGWMGWATS